MRHKTEKYTIWKCNNKCHCNVRFCEPHPFFVVVFVGCKYTKSHTMYAAIYSLDRAMPINPLLLQDSKSATLAWKYYFAKYMQQTYSLYEPTSTFINHIPVPASLWVAAPTDLSRYLFFTVCMHSLVPATLVCTILSGFHDFTNPG